MCTKSPTRLERVAHQIFSSSLRTWCNEDENDFSNVVDKNLAWINDISSKLMVGSKVDLMKISTLDRLSKVEFDFLKVAIPNLTYFSKTYKYTPGYESSSLILKKWAGLPVVVDNMSRASPSMLINRIKFKNILLKLLMNPNNDKRIRRMQQFLINPLEIESSEPPSLDSTPVSSPNESKQQQSNVINSSQHNFLDQVPVEKRCVLTPDTSKLLNLVDEGKFPNLYIDYIEPTPGLFSTKHIISRPPKLKFNHGHKNCFLSPVRNLDWEHSLRT